MDVHAISARVAPNMTRPVNPVPDPTGAEQQPVLVSDGVLAERLGQAAA
jgi:hypothetical protein